MKKTTTNQSTPAPVKASDAEQFFDEGDVWSNELYIQCQRKAQLAIASVIALFMLCLLLAFALAMALPLRTVEPYVILVDNANGRVDVLSILKEKTVPASEVMNKYFINQYLLCREGYDRQDANPCYTKVMKMSSGSVASRYAEFMSTQNPDSPLVKYGQTKQIKLTVTNIAFLDANTASVRITKQLQNRSGNEGPPIFEVITLSFQYVLTPKTESDRLINPLGFTVTRYRTDAEVVR